MPRVKDEVVTDKRSGGKKTRILTGVLSQWLILTFGPVDSSQLTRLDGVYSNFATRGAL